MPVQKSILNVFIGSSGSEEKLRESVAELLLEINKDNVHEVIGVAPFDFNDLVTQGPVQDEINRHIHRADLAILIVGGKIGEGLRKELELIPTLMLNGVIGTALIYFLPTVAHEEEAFRELRSKVVEDLQKLRVLYYDVKSVDLFISLVRKHFLQILQDERRIAEKWKDVMWTDFFEEFRIRDPDFTDEVRNLARTSDDDLHKLQREVLCKFLDDSSSEWPSGSDCLLIARQLLLLLATPEQHAASIAACERRQFPNPIHQYISYLMRQGDPVRQRDVDLKRRSAVVSRLRDWLRRRAETPPTARNFAAYVLGMCRAREGVDELLKAACDQFEDPLVRTYSVISLGKLRERNTLLPMLDAMTREPPSELRSLMRLAVIYQSLG